MRDALGGIRVCALLQQLACPAVGNRGIDLAQAERVGMMRLQPQLVRRRFRPLPLRQRIATYSVSVIIFALPFFSYFFCF